MTELQIEIIKAYAKNGMNVSRTARYLRYHRNSIMYHFERIEDATGLNPRDFYDLVKLLRMAGVTV
jgi:DNA-binding PucR family transcriptional regulator